MSNQKLNKAKKQKNDEFYTQLIDIEKELIHYKQHFFGKIVYCNSNDSYESNFFKYFVFNFNDLGLKKLITTSYSKLPDNKAYKIEINEVFDIKNNETTNIEYIQQLLKHKSNVFEPLKSNGDFRSEECIELLKKADIVCTNPPFSLFREYVAQLVKYNKKFVIIGNINATKYKEIFPLIKENKIWLGMFSIRRDLLFIIPSDYAKYILKNGKEGSQYKIVNGILYKRTPSIWFSNLNIGKRQEKLMLYKKYTPQEYPKYDNYDAIEVSKTRNIPIDYDGVMGVPITFLEKYNPEQFEIVGKTDDKKYAGKYLIGKNPTAEINGKKLYCRILIKNKKIKKV
jgi:hypothetical protein